MDSPFEVHLTRNAEKDLLGLRDLTERATNEILALKQNPHKGHPLKGSLRGARALDFSLKGVAYRAAHVVLESERVCLVFMVGPHEGSYEKAERRVKALRQRLGHMVK
ncbi:mRNA interferase RelE/StbE [Candidatus Hakubella thermalkaliphila]|uniref:mRNA interferase RelE/StbE n=2 Tax=Candidatus Hakubella thermalkaliphila TaxID=2754717 RepID=A0A6V8PQ02_9ACTN|nr:mRNA interferase RelE/StbE [Candidatus Hakubella thermalkaliphila]